MNEFQRKLADQTGSDNYMATFGRPGREIALVDNYSYSVDAETLAAPITATASQSFDVIMDSDSDFVCTYLSGVARAVGGSMLMLNAAILVQILDQASGRTWLNRASPLPMLTGQSGFPFLLPSPRVIRPRSTLTVTVVSAQAQSFNGFYFTFHGSRIYYA